MFSRLLSNDVKAGDTAAYYKYSLTGVKFGDSFYSSLSNFIVFGEGNSHTIESNRRILVDRISSQTELSAVFTDEGIAELTGALLEKAQTASAAYVTTALSSFHQPVSFTGSGETLEKPTKEELTDAIVERISKAEAPAEWSECSKTAIFDELYADPDYSFSGMGEYSFSVKAQYSADPSAPLSALLQNQPELKGSAISGSPDFAFSLTCDLSNASGRIFSADRIPLSISDYPTNYSTIHRISADLKDYRFIISSETDDPSSKFIDVTDDYPFSKFDVWQTLASSGVIKESDEPAAYKIPGLLAFDPSYGYAYVANDTKVEDFTDEDGNVVSDTPRFAILNGSRVHYSLFDLPKTAKISYRYANGEFSPILTDGSGQNVNLTLSSLMMFYDRECRIPVEFDDKSAGIGNTYTLYYHNEQGKRVIEEEDTDYRKYAYLSAYEFEETLTPKNAEFTDWYNIDTRVNYNRFNDLYTESGGAIARANEYSLAFSSPLSSIDFRDSHVVVSKSLDDPNFITLASNCMPSFSGSVKVGIGSSGAFETISFPDTGMCNLSSLFTKEDGVRREVMLSFNFRIPKDGWTQFNSKMYADNSHYLEGIGYDTDECLPSAVITSVTKRARFAEYSGKFVAMLKVFKSDFSNDLNAAKGFNLYDAGLYETNWNAKVSERRANEFYLTLTSGNDSLAFTVRLAKASDKKDESLYCAAVSLKGLLFTVSVNGVTHNIQIPELTVGCVWDKADRQLKMSVKYSDKSMKANGDRISEGEVSSLHNWPLMVKGTPSDTMLLAFDVDGSGKYGQYRKNKRKVDALLGELAALKNELHELSNGYYKISADQLNRLKDISYGLKEAGAVSSDSEVYSLSSVLNGVTVDSTYANLDAFRQKLEKCGVSVSSDDIALYSGNDTRMIRANKSNTSSQNHSITLNNCAGWFRIYLYDHSDMFYEKSKDRCVVDSRWGVSERFREALGEIFGSGLPSVSGLTPSSGPLSSFMIGSNCYKFSHCKSWCHCGNKSLRHDVIIVALTQAGAVTNAVKINDISLETPALSGWRYMNILPILDEDPQSKFFLNWMTVNDIEFLPNSAENAYYSDFTGMKLSAIVGHDLICGGATSPSADFIGKDLSTLTDGNPMIYDIERFVKPFDMSTNLLMYKGKGEESKGGESGDGKASGVSNDEYFILNARKMYTDVDYMDKKPSDSAIRLDMASLYDREITLTGVINVKNRRALTEIYPYVNDKYEYAVSDKENDGELLSANFRQVRYTDYRDKADQWRLFRANGDIEFTTTDDFSADFLPDVQALSNVSVDSRERISVPCKMTLTFNGLVFQQNVREGVQFDDVDTIDYDEKIFVDDLFTDGMAGSMSGFELKHIAPGASGVPNGWLYKDSDDVMYRELINETDPDIPLQSDTIRKDNSIGYIVSLKSFTEIKSIGDDGYGLDLMGLNLLGKSVNRWSTQYSKTDFSDLEVYSDYNPSKARKCIGTPYTNLNDKVSLEISVPTGTEGGGAGVREFFDYVAGRFKQATDVRYVNNIRSYSEADYERYVITDNGGQVTVRLTFSEAKAVPGNDSVMLVTFAVDGLIDSVSRYGYLPVKIAGAYGKGFEYAGVDGDKDKNNPDEICVFFDGLLYDKQVFIRTNGASYKIADDDSRLFKMAKVDSSTVTVFDNGTIGGSLTLQFTDSSSSEHDTIEIHNVKLPEPTIGKIRVGFSDLSRGSLSQNGMLQVDSDLWSKFVTLNGATLDYSGAQPAFTLQEGNSLKSSCVEMYDDKGILTGVFVTLKLSGLKMFEKGSFRWRFENPKSVVLSSEELLDSYRGIGELLYSGISPAVIIPSAEYLSATFREYRHDAKIGYTVLSGDRVGNEFNSISTMPLSTSVDGVGACTYCVNPPENDKFQLEMLIKRKGEPFRKHIYYVNLPVGRWYNLSVYRHSDKSMSNAVPVSKTKFGLTLTDVDGETLSDITEKSTEIFSCFISNDSQVKGSVIESDVGIREFYDIISNGMYKYDALHTISFDPCSRYPYTLHFSTDASVLSYQDTEVTETEYERKERKNWDLFKVSEKMTDILASGFTNTDATIRLFDNQGVSDLLSGSKDFIDYGAGPYDQTRDNRYGLIYDTYGDSFSGALSGVSMASALVNFSPRRIFLNDSDEYYILRKKDMRYHISPVPGMCAKSVMWVVSPDFSEPSDDNKGKPSYVTNASDSSIRLKEFKGIFDNPQNKMPAVSYGQKILNSDYATLVYNSCKSFAAVETDESRLSDVSSKYILNYSKNPTVIAYVWGNSQVSRNETYTLEGVRNANRLHYSRIASDFEYIAEVGSIYNYEDGANETNIVVVETSPSTERQTVLQPVMSSPLDIEKISNETAYVKVKDRIIATAALGYNSAGYSKNGVMVFDPRSSAGKDVRIDTTQTTYLYLSQNDQSTNCSFGVTQEKPVYVDTVSQNYESLPEMYSILPKLEVKDKSPEEMDELLSSYYVFSKGSGVFTVPINTQNVYDYDRRATDKVSVSAYQITVDLSKNIDNIDSASSVFIDEADWIRGKKDINVSEKALITKACYDFDGVLKEENKCPEVTLEWSTTMMMRMDGKTLTYEKFRNDVSGASEVNGVVLSDTYGSVSLSDIEISIKKEHIDSAPVHIEAWFLVAKRNGEDGSIALDWAHDEYYDFDIRETYKDEFDLVKRKKTMHKSFPDRPDGSNLAKNCFGIKLKIRQIMPQNLDNVKAVIDDIRIYASNITNRHGNASWVNDVYVRKSDANCRNHYSMDVSEYVWRLPNSLSEWKTVSGILEQDSNSVSGSYDLIDQDHHDIIMGSGFIPSLSGDGALTGSVSDQLSSNSAFSFMNAFYITDDVANRSIRQVLSDSYMVDSNMRVTWKYVDYVYITYSSYGQNSRLLLGKYFGDKVYNAVKAKLINNINNMNSNSAFKDRFEFSGGIMVCKEESMNEDQHTDLFKWNTSHQVEENWTEVYTQTTSQVEVHEPAVVYETTTTTYMDKRRNGKTVESKALNSVTSQSVEGEVRQKTLTETTVQNRLNSVKDHYGAAIENGKYSNVENWTKSMQPVMLKFKIS